jgi:hypothetical protein
MTDHPLVVEGFDTCPECGFTAKNKQGLSMHVLRKHSSKATNWPNSLQRKKGERRTSRNIFPVKRRQVLDDFANTPSRPITGEMSSLIMVHLNDSMATGLGVDGSIWICEKVRDG